MQKYSKQVSAGFSAKGMEPGNHYKNGAYMKSYWMRQNLCNTFIRWISLAAILLTAVACGNKDTPLTPPSTPTGLTANVVGNAIVIDWNSVGDSNVGYKIERSNTTNSNDFNYLGDTPTNSYYDVNPLNGNNYYRVRAYYGDNGGNVFSGYSDYTSCYYDPNGGSDNGTGGGGGGGTDTPPTVAPCAPNFGYCTVSGTTITLTWTVSTSFGCGTPTSAVLKVTNPDGNGATVLQTLSGNATSASFNYTQWVNTAGVYTNGLVYMAIILENAQGSTAGIKVYDSVGKTWIY